MAIFSNTGEIADRFGDYIEELRAILVANNIKFGSPENLFEFARRLQSDDLLPGDLSRMVESIVDRESDKVSPVTILSIIAIAVGGLAIAEPDHDLRKPAKLIVDFLIRSGTCSPTDPDHMETMCMAPFTMAANPEKDLSMGEAYSPSHTELPPNDRPVDQIDKPPWAGSSSDTLPLRPFDDTTKLIQSLARLELNATQAKLYLDSVEQLIGRMELRLENIPSLVTPPPDQSTRPDIEPLPPTDLLVEPPSISSDLPLPDFVGQASPRAKQHLAWSFALGRKLAAPPLLATIAGGTLLYIGYHRSSTNTGISHAVPGAATTINQSSATATVANVPQPQYALTVVPTEHAVKPQPTKPSAAGLPKPNALHSKTTKNRTPGSTESAPDHAAHRSVLHANVEAAETPQPPDSTEPVDRKDVRYIPTHASMRSVPSSQRIINVASGVMAANLLSASPPSYPKLASLTHMQGKVVMQAIISEDGTVQNLHVIQGHRLLRGAAKNSARTWRYRPYLVNGKPVEVATIVSVDFILGHTDEHPSTPAP
jgi:outer membrane biosynthesis protein TonB